ncbi:MAG: alkaline phosphatase family protein, partial [Rhizobacter sp.]|nr:alkaline phosphatase family protein [Chlorobiales bacterium]
TGVSPERMIFIDDYIDPQSVRIADLSAVTAIFPKAGEEEKIYQAFIAKPHPHLKVYRKSEVPMRFHYQASRRISPVVLVADEGWSISTRNFFEGIKAKNAGGAHGYDNQLPSMRALFIAHGQGFKQATTVEPFENVHLYELMCHLLSLTPAPNDGSLDSIRGVLK